MVLWHNWGHCGQRGSGVPDLVLRTEDYFWQEARPDVRTQRTEVWDKNVPRSWICLKRMVQNGDSLKVEYIHAKTELSPQKRYKRDSLLWSQI